MRGVIHDLKKDLGLKDYAVPEKNLDESLADFNYNNHNTSGKPGVNGSRPQSSQSNGRHSSDHTGTRNLNNTTLRSDMTGTLESTSTMKFGRSTEMFDIIRSD